MKAKFPVSSFQFQRSSNASSGVALIGIIIAIIVMGLLGGSVLMLITTSSMESLQTMKWSKAFFAAEAGISKAKEYMTTNAAWYTNFSCYQTGMIGQASFSNNISTNAQSNVFVTATGVQDDSRWTSKWYPSASEITRAILVYIQSGQVAPLYRTCSNLRRLSNAFIANTVSNVPQWQRIETCPSRNEFILVAQNSDQRIFAQTYINGDWVSNTWLNTSGVTPAANCRGFDVAYESLSNRGMVVYSVGNSSNPMYRIWTSDSWTAPQFVPINTSATNPVSWVRLISRPNTNEIMCLARWRRTAAPVGNYSSAIIWNGTGWVNRTTLETNCNSTITYETMDGAYSAATGLVVYINGATATAQRSPKYRTYTNGVWSDEKTNSYSLGSAPCWIRVEYSSDGSLAYAGFLTTTSRRFRGAYWNGSTWGDYNTFGNNSLDIISRRCFDIAWSSHDNTLMVVYSQNQNAQSYLRATWGGSSNYGELVSTDDGQWCVLKADPFTPEFYYMALDDANDVNLQRWAGTNWTLFPELTNNSALTYLSIDFAFRRDSASTNCWPLR